MDTRAWFLVASVALIGAACDTSSSDAASSGGASATGGGTGTGAATDTGMQMDPTCAFETPSGACCEATNAAILAPEVVLLRAAVTVDGEAPPQSVYENGFIALRDPTSAGIAVIGQTREGTIMAPVLRGTYQVLFEADRGGAVLPINDRALVVDKLDLADAPIAENPPDGVTLPTIDATVPIVTTTLAGAVEIDGEAPPLSVYDDARLWLHDLATGARTDVSHTALDGGTFSVRVVPGDYELRYQSIRKGAVLPVNGDALLGEFTVAAERDLGVVAVATAQVGAAITLDGATPPASEYDNGAIYLRDAATDDLILAGETRDGALAGPRVIASSLAGPARYATHYARLKSGELLPRNEWAELAPPREPAAIGDIDLATTALTASLEVDGAAPVGTDIALLGLLGDGGDRAVLGATTGAPVAAPVLTGLYTAFYGHQQSTSALPANTRAALALPIDTSAQSEVPITLATVVVSGKFTLGGAAPPTSAYDDGEVFLLGEGGDRVHLGHTREGSYERRVIAGVTYQVCYAATSAGAVAPGNGQACLDAPLYTADKGAAIDFDIDIPVVTAEIHLAAPLGTGPYDRGLLFLRHLVSGDEIFVGTSDQEYYSVRVVPGPYEVLYRLDVAGPSAPRNQDAALGCFVTAG